MQVIYNKLLIWISLSFTNERKVKSLLGRWFTKHNTSEDSHDVKDVADIKDKEGHLCIKSDRIIICQTLNSVPPIIRIKTKLCYRILSVCAKQHNKWFMTKNIFLE